MTADQLAARLVTIVGASHVLTDPSLLASYEVDWTGRWRGEARLAVRPGSVEEVSRVVVACAAVGAPIVPQGGNTGLVGGAVPAGVRGAVVLSLRRLSWLDPVDSIAGQVMVGAGATLAEVQRHARAAGWDLGLDFAARDSATIGGAVATNAGGTHVLRYGTARAQVVDVEAVLADGRILSRPRTDRATGPQVRSPGPAVHPEAAGAWADPIGGGAALGGATSAGGGAVLGGATGAGREPVSGSPGGLAGSGPGGGSAAPAAGGGPGQGVFANRASGAAMTGGQPGSGVVRSVAGHSPGAGPDPALTHSPPDMQARHGAAGHGPTGGVSGGGGVGPDVGPVANWGPGSPGSAGGAGTGASPDPTDIGTEPLSAIGGASGGAGVGPDVGPAANWGPGSPGSAGAGAGMGASPGPTDIGGESSGAIGGPGGRRPGGGDPGWPVAGAGQLTGGGGLADSPDSGGRAAHLGPGQVAGAEVGGFGGSGGLVKDSAGYDLPGLLAGSEGTLAILTAIRLRLVPALPARVVALLGVNGTAAAQRVLSAVRRRVADLSAAELLHADGLALVCEHGSLPGPVAAAPSYLLIECAGWNDPTEALAAALDGLPEVRDAAVANDPAGRAALWRYREALPEAINAAGVPVKLDVALPPATLPAAEDAIRRAVAAIAPAPRTILFGHLAEANLHVNVLDATPVAEQVTDAVLRVVVGFGGSISAEHGVGRAKSRWLALSRSPVEIATMRAIKSAVDPAGLLNPGVLLP